MATFPWKIDYSQSLRKGRALTWTPSFVALRRTNPPSVWHVVVPLMSSFSLPFSFRLPFSLKSWELFRCMPFHTEREKEKKKEDDSHVMKANLQEPKLSALLEDNKRSTLIYSHMLLYWLIFHVMSLCIL